MEPSLDALKMLCESMRLQSEIEIYGGSDSVITELPFKYPEGGNLRIRVSGNGEISDDGETWSQLAAQDREGLLEKWGSFPSWLRTNAMEYRGGEIFFIGKKNDFANYIASLQSIPHLAPSRHSPSTAFDVVLSNNLKQNIRRIIPKEDAAKETIDLVFHPKYHVAPEVNGTKIALQLPLSFQSMNGREQYTVLSHPEGSRTDRVEHICYKLRYHRHLTDEDKQHTKFPVLIPAESNYDERDYLEIELATGSEPQAIDPKNDARSIARKIVYSADGVGRLDEI